MGGLHKVLLIFHNHTPHGWTQRQPNLPQTDSEYANLTVHRGFPSPPSYLFLILFSIILHFLISNLGTIFANQFPYKCRQFQFRDNLKKLTHLNPNYIDLIISCCIIDWSLDFGGLCTCFKPGPPNYKVGGSLRVITSQTQINIWEGKKYMLLDGRDSND